jgi:site-specific DNA-methyltransferase (adenine-specific)
MIDLRLGDCLEVMQTIPDKSINAIICDLPYGTTACKWDSVIPFEPLWAQYKRIIKDNGAIVLTASQPFTSALVMSNLKWFKYEWIWEKAVGSNFATVKYQPMKEHENILVFGNGKINYYPQMQERKGTCKGKIPNYTNTNSKSKGQKTEVYNSLPSNRDGKIYSILRNPSSVQFFNNRIANDRGNHPTQKPVTLMEYLVKTYTNQGDTVLDNCMGSGTTGVACKNLGRKFIGIEQDANYFEIAKKRINE